MTFQQLANRVLRFVMSLVLDYQVEGLENLPEEGPLIVVQNHMIFIDTVIAAVFIDREVVGMSKAENFDNPLVALFFNRFVNDLPAELQDDTVVIGVFILDRVYNPVFKREYKQL